MYLGQFCFLKQKHLLCAVTFAAVCMLSLTACGGDQPEDKIVITVHEYSPAMGQFVNLLPKYQEGFTEADMCREAEQYLTAGSPITLGGFGGYVTFSVGRSIKNQIGYDFRILGNAFRQASEEGEDAEYGNSEPGAVWVSRDDNGNGKPDDSWYELAGSDYSLPTTVRGYKKTWHKSDTTLNNPYHTQPYYPQWRQDTAFTVQGTLLAPAARQKDGVWAQRIRDYGYADNKPNTDIAGTSFDIDWAVDEQGRKVKLDRCDFVRVMTAVDEHYPMIGELSTEVAGVALY